MNSKCQSLFLANIYLTPMDFVGAVNPQRDSAKARGQFSNLFCVNAKVEVMWDDAFVHCKDLLLVLV